VTDGLDSREALASKNNSIYKREMANKNLQRRGKNKFMNKK
jgi:hypothetical protein